MFGGINKKNDRKCFIRFPYDLMSTSWNETFFSRFIQSISLLATTDRLSIGKRINYLSMFNSIYSFIIHMSWKLLNWPRKIEREWAKEGIEGQRESQKKGSMAWLSAGRKDVFRCAYSLALSWTFEANTHTHKYREQWLNLSKIWKIFQFSERQ